MPKKKNRVTRTQRTPSDHNLMTFPVLVMLLMSVVVAGMFLYTGLLIAGSAIFVGFFGWLWWTRRVATKRKTPVRSMRKPRKR